MARKKLDKSEVSVNVDEATGKVDVSVETIGNLDDFAKKMTESFTSALSNSGLGSKLDAIISGQEKIFGKEVTKGRGKNKTTTIEGGILGQIADINKQIANSYTQIEKITKDINKLLKGTATTVSTSSASKTSTKTSKKLGFVNKDLQDKKFIRIGEDKRKSAVWKEAETAKIGKKELNDVIKQALKLNKAERTNLVHAVAKVYQKHEPVNKPDRYSILAQLAQQQSSLMGEFREQYGYKGKPLKPVKQRVADEEKQRAKEQIQQDKEAKQRAKERIEDIKDIISDFKNETKTFGVLYKNKILDEGERSNIQELIESISEFRETLGSEYRPQSRKLNELVNKLENIINKSDEKEARQREREASQQGNNKNQSMLAKAILSFLPGGGGINNIFRMVGKMHPLLAGLFVVLGGILGGINKIIPIMELFNDIMAVAFIKSVMGFQDLASFFKGANITEGVNGAKSARQSSREATQKQQQEMANAEVAQRIGTVSVNGKKMPMYNFHGQQVVSAHNLNLHGMVAQGKAQYVPLKNISKLMEYDEYMFQQGRSPIYTSFMGGKHAIGSDISRSHWGGGKLDDAGKPFTKDMESTLKRAGAIGNGAVGWHTEDKTGKTGWHGDVGYAHIKQGSLVQGYKAPVIKSEYDKGFADFDARRKQKELEQKQKELDKEKENKTVDITGGTQSDIVRSAINTMPYLDSDSPTMSDSVKNSIMGVQNSFGIFGI